MPKKNQETKISLLKSTFVRFWLKKFALELFDVSVSKQFGGGLLALFFYLEEWMWIFQPSSLVKGISLLQSGILKNGMI